MGSIVKSGTYQVPPFISTNVEHGMRRDLWSRAGADRLADEIEMLWHSFGELDVKVWAIEILYPDGSGTGLFSVTSNLVNGLPPRGRVIEFVNRRSRHG